MDRTATVLLDEEEIFNSLTEKIEEVYSETAESRQDYIHFLNLSFEEFISHVDKFNLFDNSSIEPNLIEEQLLVFIQMEENKNFAVLTDNDHLIPYIPNSELTMFIKTNKDKIIENGFLFDMKSTENNYGMTVFIPYLKGKKIYGFYKCVNHLELMTPVRQYFHVNNCKENEIIPTVKIPSMDGCSLDREINEEEIIRIANFSSKFEKLARSWKTALDAIDELDFLLHKTTDPNYIEKILLVSNMISFGDLLEDTDTAVV